MYVRESDHALALHLLDRAAASESRAELTANVMPVLHDLFHADEVSHTVVLTSKGRVEFSDGFPTPGTAQPDALHAYESRPLEHPWVIHVTGRGPARTVRLTDLLSRTELHSSAFYQDFFKPRAIDYADYQTISTANGRAIGFSVGRQARDFTTDEHDLLEHLRGPLGRIWHLVSRIETLNAASFVTIASVTGVGLTAAERRVSALVLRGWRTVTIAQALGVSTKAVEQHLTRIYRKADVGSRAEYIMQSFEAKQRRE
jgi:DNA-binding CsgD family transcriptional regulator